MEDKLELCYLIQFWMKLILFMHQLSKQILNHNNKNSHFFHFQEDFNEKYLEIYIIIK